MNEEILDRLEKAAVRTGHHAERNLTVFVFPDYFLIVSPEGVVVSK